MTNQTANVIGGVDTHKRTHYAAVIDDHGKQLGHREFPAHAGGYAALLAGVRSHGHVAAIGVESTGSFGATLTRFLVEAGEEVVEVNKPNRQARHIDGKSDRLDAEQIAIEAERYREIFNTIRPHEALDMARPRDIYLTAIPNFPDPETEPET